MSEELPDGWEWTTIADLMVGSLFSDGDWVEKKDQDPDGPVRLVQLADIGEGVFRDRSDRWMTEAAAERLGCTNLAPDDVLVARMPDPIGRACLLPEFEYCSVTAVDVCILRPDRDVVCPKWLMWMLNSPDAHAQVVSLQSGTTRKRVSRRNLGTVRLPLPPLAEQETIVAAIEEHLSRLDAADSLLSSATRRLEMLVGASLQRSASADSVPIGDVLVDSNYGTSAKCDYNGGGPPVLRIPNIQSRRVSMGDLKHAKAAEDVGDSAYVRDGDLLVVRTNGSRGLIGRTAVVRAPAPSLAFASYLIRLQFDPARVLPEFASMMFESPHLRQEIEARAASSAGQYNLSLAKIKPLEIPLPSLSEQGVLVERFLALEEQARRFESALRAAEAHSASLRRTILSAAFAGHLGSRYDMEVSPA